MVIVVIYSSILCGLRISNLLDYVGLEIWSHSTGELCYPHPVSIRIPAGDDCVRCIQCITMIMRWYLVYVM